MATIEQIAFADQRLRKVLETVMAEQTKCAELITDAHQNSEWNECNQIAQRRVGLMVAETVIHYELRDLRELGRSTVFPKKESGLWGVDFKNSGDDPGP